MPAPKNPIKKLSTEIKREAKKLATLRKRLKEIKLKEKEKIQKSNDKMIAKAKIKK